MLKQEGVEKAILMMSWHDLQPANEETNVYLAEYCREHPELIPIAYLEPYSAPNLPRLLEKLVKEHGIKGLKLHPPSGFYPNDPLLYPLYAKAMELNLPVFFHIGSSVFLGMRMKYSRPIFLDDLAVDFPDLTLIMIHCGRGFDYDAAFFLSKLHRNIYMDITGLPPARLMTYFPDLEKNSEKIIFGSDWPSMPAGIKQNIEGIQNLPLKSSTIEKILYKNVKRLIDQHQMV